LESCNLLTAVDELVAKVVNLAIEGSDLVYIVALVVSAPAAATDVEVETTENGYVNVDRITIARVVPVVTVECSASLSEEVNVFAKTETEVQTCRNRKSPRLIFDTFVASAAIQAAGSEFAIAIVDSPSVVTTDTYEGKDAEYAVGVNTTDRVKHIPHQLCVQVNVFLRVSSHWWVAL
jgi:hypothetical protein